VLIRDLRNRLTPWKTMAERSFASDSAMFNTWLDVVREEIVSISPNLTYPVTPFK
jgi:hypothetical protein